MDFRTQITGLDKFFATVFDGDTNLESLLSAMGFNTLQQGVLQENHLPAIAASLIDIIHKRLTWEDKDLWYRILSRRLGLDGEPPLSMKATAQALNIDVSYASYAEGNALQKCRTKSAQGADRAKTGTLRGLAGSRRSRSHGL